jgi:uncharacterized protein (DUF1697 family)
MPIAPVVAFLRAINVGGHIVTMDKLRGLFTKLGYDGVETFIASGNVVFQARATGGAALEKKIEAGLQQALGYEVKTFVRSGPEVAAIAAFTPFTPARWEAGATRVVGFLAEPLSKDAHHALMKLRGDRDDFQVNGREIYWLSTFTQSESKISNVLLERTLKASTTFRGINTIHRLTAKYAFVP